MNELPINYIIFGGIATVIVCIISYFIWKKYLSSKVLYDSNRENNEKEQVQLGFFFIKFICKL